MAGLAVFEHTLGRGREESSGEEHLLVRRRFGVVRDGSRCHPRSLRTSSPLDRRSRLPTRSRPRIAFALGLKGAPGLATFRPPRRSHPIFRATLGFWPNSCIKPAGRLRRSSPACAPITAAGVSPQNRHQPVLRMPAAECWFIARAGMGGCLCAPGLAVRQRRFGAQRPRPIEDSTGLANRLADPGRVPRPLALRPSLPRP